MTENSQAKIINTEGKNVILDVPYFSQYLDIKNALEGARSCGITCVKMVLEYFHSTDLSLQEWVDKGMSEGGFGRSGWIHDYFVKIFNDNNLTAYRKEKMKVDPGLLEILQSLENKNPVIVSVERRLFDDPSFHMVLVVGFKKDNDGKILGFYYNDPAKTTVESGKNKFVEIDSFVEYWRKMAIFVSKEK
jgi:uncharacterized protein YvpB